MKDSIVNWLESVGKKAKSIKNHTHSDEKDEQTVHYEFSIDSPKSPVSDSHSLTIRGWIIPLHETKVRAVRIINNKTRYPVEYGVERKDVVKARPSIAKDVALHSGFESHIDFEDGSISVEVDFGSGYESIYSLNVKYSLEKTFESFQVPELANNIAEHKVLLENKKVYFYKDASDKNYEPNNKDPRLVAFYLPQFHPIKENDMAWGKGFTDWRNVTTGEPRVIGHEQPLLPSDLGYYDLRNESVIEEQIELAKKYGIHAFCFYYYWFSGERLLEKPLDSFLRNKSWDFNFMICWANENWTKRWDGRDQDVIIAQKYLKEDPLRFIKDIEPILLDPRYVKENGKPVLAVYRGSELKEPNRYINEWREYFRKKHGMELHIISMMNFDASDPRPHGFDSGVEFSPLTTYRKTDFDTTRAHVKDVEKKLLDVNYTGVLVDYRALLPQSNGYKQFDFPTYKSVSPSWDNDARKKGKKSLTLYAANPDIYGKWLSEVIEQETSVKEAPLVFINAWNEWAEGAVLEPTLRYGHANLLRTAEVLAQFSNNPKNKLNFPLYEMSHKTKSHLAIIIHISNENGWEVINKKIRALMTPFDLYITLSSRAEHLRPSIVKEHASATIVKTPNRGRDILPFTTILTRISGLKYEYILKLHTKEMDDSDDTTKQFNNQVDSLIGNNTIVEKILHEMGSGTGLVGPAHQYVSLWDNIGSERTKQIIFEYMEKIMGDYNALNRGKPYNFFHDAMFWCRTDSLYTIANLLLSPEDFESEKGQHDGTLAHAMERIITLVPFLDGKNIAVSNGSTVTSVENTTSNYSQEV